MRWPRARHITPNCCWKLHVRLEIGYVWKNYQDILWSSWDPPASTVKPQPKKSAIYTLAFKLKLALQIPGLCKFNTILCVCVCKMECSVRVWAWVEKRPYLQCNHERCQARPQCVCVWVEGDLWRWSRADGKISPPGYLLTMLLTVMSTEQVGWDTQITKLGHGRGGGQRGDNGRSWKEVRPLAATMRKRVGSECTPTRFSIHGQT